jgi:hypothetical protein
MDHWIASRYSRENLQRKPCFSMRVLLTVKKKGDSNFNVSHHPILGMKPHLEEIMDPTTKF